MTVKILKAGLSLSFFVFKFFHGPNDQDITGSRVHLNCKAVCKER